MSILKGRSLVCKNMCLGIANWLVCSNIRLKLILLNDTMMSRRIHTTTVVVGVVDNASDKMGYLALADTRKKHMYVLVHYTTAFIYNRVRNLSIIVISNIYFFITKFEERINTHTCYAGQFIIYTWACKYSFRLYIPRLWVPCKFHAYLYYWYAYF